MANKTTLNVDPRFLDLVKEFRKEVASVAPRLEALGQAALLEMTLEVARCVLKSLRILGDPGAFQGISGKNAEIHRAGGIPPGPLQDIFLEFRPRFGGTSGRPRADAEFDRRLTRAFDSMPLSLKTELIGFIKTYLNAHGLVNMLPVEEEIPPTLRQVPPQLDQPPKVSLATNEPMPVPLRQEMLRRLKMLKEAGRESEYNFDDAYDHWKLTGELPGFEEMDTNHELDVSTDN